jgi:hypothetical protein
MIRLGNSTRILRIFVSCPKQNFERYRWANYLGANELSAYSVHGVDFTLLSNSQQSQFRTFQFLPIALRVNEFPSNKVS